jgi:hypothetical protein
VGHVVHSGASEARNGDAIFFMLGWDRYRFDKKTCRATIRRTCVIASGGAEPVFLHPVGSAGQVVHSGASGA